MNPAHDVELSRLREPSRRQGRARPKPRGAYLPVLADAVHGVLVAAELHGADLPAVGLPAHGALVLLHV